MRFLCRRGIHWWRRVRRGAVRWDRFLLPRRECRCCGKAQVQRTYWLSSWDTDVAVWEDVE